MAINDTADSVKRLEELDIGRAFDRPTRYTQRAALSSAGVENTAGAQVGVKRVQAGYLRLQVSGGVRRPMNAALVVPVKARRNAYGNLPKGALARLKAKPDIFVTTKRGRATSHLPPGVYQRKGLKGSGLKMLISFEPSGSYTAHWQFHDLAMRRARGVFHDHFVRRLRLAIETAR